MDRQNSSSVGMGLDKDPSNNNNNNDDEENYATARWDLFQSPLSDDEEPPFDESMCYHLTLKTLKILAYLITFALVLGSAVVSKLSLLIMTTRIGRESTVRHCDNITQNLNVPPNGWPIFEEEKIYWTWVLFIAFVIPELFTFLRSLRFCIFKGQNKPSWLQFAVPFVAETLHTFGLALFVYVVLPALDSVKGAMISTMVCLIPAILSFLSGFSGTTMNVYRGLDIAAIAFQVIALGLWAIFPERSATNLWLLPISAVLISIGWWQNYTSNDSPFGFMKAIANLKQKLTDTGYFSYMLISLWKIFLFFLLMIMCHSINGGNVNHLFSKLTDSFGFKVNLNDTGSNISVLAPPNGSFVWTHPVFFHVLSGGLCYISAKYACKISIHQFSFALPLVLTIPVTILTLFLLDDNDTCFLNSPFYGNLFFSVPEGKGQAFSKHHVWVLIFWLLSQIWITIHIWFPKRGLAPTERIFVIPMYNGFLVDQSIALNKTKDKLFDEDDNGKGGLGSGYGNSEGIGDGFIEGEKALGGAFQIPDDIPRIKACATMWHETREEMIELMKSIYRMDEDQCARRNAVQYFEINMRELGYYEYETHILFDDAFQLSDREDPNSPMILNAFVKEFIEVVDEAALHIHEGFVSIRPPEKYPTPYGGRLVYTLPGKTKMIVHLKDKSKIRHKKRWSQCMYMYYLLGYQLMEKPIKSDRKEIIANNTFLLALDGDVDFQPKAVSLLVDLMKKNEKLGAACGRIHPTGGGPMVWYQKFEYATGHWLQKATEHVIGCVLCSPGCFSLFRGRALMNDAVMGTYTTISTEPRHYVQYDQGEDRWLCTLLVQQGYRVDYSAASDAYTHAPEDFNEFYNQRRRWVPSTTANIMDLLTDSRKTIKVNPDISILYIAYQFMLMFGTILGPGTIFLMLVGACITLFGLSPWVSFGLNLCPIVLFAFVCYFFKNDIQLKVAQILSVIYALLMVGVLVGIAVLVSQEGLLAPSSLFLVIIASSFIFAAILHPLEIDCLIHGLVYYITIPSMYLLLIIFSVFNINNVSWGTREGPKVKSKQELEAEAKELEELKKKKDSGGILSFLFAEGKNDSEGSLEFNCGGLFKLMCCTHKKEDSARIGATLEDVSKKLDSLEKKINAGSESQQSINRRTFHMNAGTKLDETIAEESSTDEPDREPKSLRVPSFTPRDDMKNPFWITEPCLLRRKIDQLPEEEITFWKELIEKYLLPIDADKKKEKEAADALLALRNSSVFYFFLANGMFVLLIFFLDLNKESLSIKWPLGNNDLYLEPIGFTFVLFFAVVLLIQFSAMLIHRFGTLSHILASTELNLFALCGIQKDLDSIKKQGAVAKNGIGLIKALQKMKSVEEDAADKKKKKNDTAHGQKHISIQDLVRRTMFHKNFDNLDERFEKNFQHLANLPQSRQSNVFGVVGDKPSKARDTFVALSNRMSRIQTRNSRSGSTVSGLLKSQQPQNSFGNESAAGGGSGTELRVPRQGFPGSSTEESGFPNPNLRLQVPGQSSIPEEQDRPVLRRNKNPLQPSASSTESIKEDDDNGIENPGFQQDLEKEI